MITVACRCAECKEARARYPDVERCPDCGHEEWTYAHHDHCLWMEDHRQ